MQQYAPPKPVVASLGMSLQQRLSAAAPWSSQPPAMQAALARVWANAHKPAATGGGAAGEKRKVSPYIVFTKEMRPKIVKDNPGMGFGDVGKALGEVWKKLTDAQKDKYKQ